MGGQPTFHVPAAGDIVDRYEVLALVGHGGMASVFAVRRDHAVFDKLLALKLLLPHLSEQARFVRMFFDEARIAAHISHENVVTVFDVGDYDGAPYLVMEYLAGLSLSRVLGAAPGLSRPTLLGVLACVAEGLHAAHTAVDGDGTALGIVHRDVSPQNVVLCFDGRVKVVDFGIAAAQGRLTNTRSGEVKGKISYLAPEQLDRSYPIEARTDLWAFGVMAWQALAGRPLFSGESHSETMWNIMHREVPDLLDVDPEIPVDVADLVDQCLQRRPFDRPESAARCAEVIWRAAARSAEQLRGELAEEMASRFEEEKLGEQERTEAFLSPRTTDAPAKTAESSSRRRRWIVAAAAILGGVGALAVGLGALFAGGPTDVASEPTPARLGVNARSPRSTPAAADDGPIADAPDRSLELDAPQAAMLVLVDGQRHDERPLRIPLEEGAHSEVVVVTSEGERRHRVDLATARDALVHASAAPRRPPDRRARRRRSPDPPESEPDAPTPSADSTPARGNDLLDVPL